MEEEKKVEETKVEAPKKKSGTLKLLYWLVVIGGCVFIFLGSYKIGYKLGNYFGDKKSGNTSTTKKESNSNVESNSNIESNSNVESNSNTTSNVVEPKKVTVDMTKLKTAYTNEVSSYKDDELYSVADLNNDGVPELLHFVTAITESSNTVVADLFIYTFDATEGKLVSAGIVYGRVDNDTSVYALNDGTFVLSYYHMGYEKNTYYKLDNNWVVRTKDNDAVQAANPTKFDGTAVQFKKASDKTLLATIK